MISFCTEKTRELIYDIVRPKNVIFIGSDAPTWLGISFQHPIDSVLVNNVGNPLVQKKLISNIPHFKIHHTSMNFSYNAGENLEAKKRYFEEVFG